MKEISEIKRKLLLGEISKYKYIIELRKAHVHNNRIIQRQNKISMGK